MTDMQAPRHIGMTRGLTLACALLVAVVSTPAARADDLEDKMPDTWLFRQILQGIGLRSNSVDIDYRERSPLVVPPQLTLPPPETRSVAERNPQWPVDQDVRRQKEAATARANAKPFQLHEEAVPLGPDQLAPGRGRAPAGAVSGPLNPARVEGAPISQSALGYVGGMFDKVFDRNKAESKPFTGEPPRTALIEPPPGYQTPSPKQPYGVGKRQLETVVYDPMTMQATTMGAPSR